MRSVFSSLFIISMLVSTPGFARKAMPEATMPKPPPKPAATTRAIFFYTGGLVPLACYDTTTKKAIKKDADCFKIVTSGSVVFPNGVSVKIKGKATGYTSGVNAVKGLGIDSEQKDTDWLTPIAYPNNKDLALTRYEAPKANATPSADEAAALEKLLKPKKGQSVAVYQKVSADLDGDGVEETIYSANIPETEGSYFWSGIVVAKGGDLTKLMSAYSYPKSSGKAEQRAWFNASFDLEGDGKKELSVVHAYLADYTQACLKLSGKKLVAVPFSNTPDASK